MKYLVKFFVVTFFLLVSTHTFAEQKIVILDMSYVLNNSKAGKEAQDFLKKKSNDYAKKYSELEKSLKKEEIDLLEKKNIISKEEYSGKSDSLRKKVIDYQSQRRASLDKIAKQRVDARKKMIAEITPIIDSHIKENKISIILDKKYMIGGLNEFDITNAIVEKLNKELPSLNLK